MASTGVYRSRRRIECQCYGLNGDQRRRAAAGKGSAGEAPVRLTERGCRRATCWRSVGHWRAFGRRADRRRIWTGSRCAYGRVSAPRQVLRAARIVWNWRGRHNGCDTIGNRRALRAVILSLVDNNCHQSARRSIDA